MSYSYLEIIAGIETGRRYKINDGANSIGRGIDNSIVIHVAEKSASSHHALLYKNGDQLLLQDMQSTNGTFVNEAQVSETTVMPGNILSLGKKGPQLKIIESSVALETTPAPTAGFRSTLDNCMPSDTQKIRTSPGQPLMISSDDPTANESLESVLKERDAHEAQQNQKLLSPGLSFTVDLERKIVQQNISPTELKQLLRSKKRVNKLEERGKLTGSQVSFLKTAHQAHAQSRRNWLYILAGVGAVFCCVCAVLVIRVMHYQRMLSHGLTLEQKLDSYESKIQKVKQSGADTMLLAALVAELDRTNQELNGVQSKLNKNDVAEKFYADPLERKIDLVLQRFGETDYHIPAEMVARVKFHMEMFGGRMKPMMGRYIERKNKYAPMIEKAFRERNLPADLQYIAMLESGFNPEALSHAGARGMWQFMEHTGRRYGLQIDATVDERLDPQKATLAAAQYFKELIGIFGGKSSVMLAMAAYNAGEGRIMGALRKVDDPIRNRDFWYIYRMGYLAEETNEYIPRVIALLILSENQQEYGLTPGSGRSGGASTIVEEKPSAIDYFSPLDVEAGRVDSSAIKKFIKNF